MNFTGSKAEGIVMKTQTTTVGVRVPAPLLEKLDRAVQDRRSRGERGASRAGVVLDLVRAGVGAVQPVAQEAAR